MKRTIALVMLLVTAMAATATPENEEPTNVRDSECFDCHKAGGEGSGPIMSEVFRIFMYEPPTVEKNQSTTLSFEIKNWWTAELRGFSGHIDISDAPSFSFASAPRPPVSSFTTGSLPEYEPAAFYQGESRSTRVTIEVEAGGSDMLLEMSPESGADNNLLMRIWNPNSNPNADPPDFERDQGGDGEPESIRIRANPVPGGTYTIEVEETPDTFETSQGMFDPVQFQINWTTSFDFDPGQPRQAGGTNDVLDGQEPSTPQSTVISWDVNVVSEINSVQTVKVYMESVAYYRHAPQFQAVDEWLYWNDVEYVFTPTGNGTTVEIARISPVGDLVTEFIAGEGEIVEVESADEEGPDLTAEEELRVDIAAEIVGYAAAFLLIFSLITGGAFGNWSRRLQQWFIYKNGRHRVSFHNLISYALIVAATAHLILFLVEPRYPWEVGVFLGGVSILGMYLSGITGAWQMGMVRVIGHEGWRWLHYMSFVMAFGGAAFHVLLDGIHFATFQESIGWQDPVAPALEQLIPEAETVREIPETADG